MTPSSGSPPTCLAAFRAGYFFSREENCMKMYANENLITVSLGAAFVNSIGTVVSISELSVFRSDHVL